MQKVYGNLLTNDIAIEKRVLEAYSERLKPNIIQSHLESYETIVNKLCESRLKLTQLNKSEPWAMQDLEEAMKNLDVDKSRDAIGHANEIFKEGVAGTDLKSTVLIPMNRIKSEQIFPEALEPCNITSLYKHKGSQKELNNYRGVFRTTVLRSILDRFIYNDSYQTINDNLTDHNVCARKNRNIRDNIFVLGAVNSIVNEREEPIEIQVGDIKNG